MLTEPDRKPKVGVDDNGRELNDLLTTIAERAEQLIGSLDPSGASFQHAQEIGRATLSAVRRVNPAHSRNTAPPEGRPAPVLVVEDEPGMREFIRVVLMRAGHDVVIASSPRAALEALRRQPAISLMLVDIVMPEMDGYEVAFEARRISPGVHVVFVSAFAPDTARQPGDDGFLAKPFTSDALIDVVKKTLSK